MDCFDNNDSIVTLGEISDEYVEKFARKIQDYIINNNKEKLVENTSNKITISCLYFMEDEL